MTPGRSAAAGLAATPLPAAQRGLARRLTLDPAVVDFAVRGFRTDRPESRLVLERHGTAFIDGFNAAVTGPLAEIHDRLACQPELERGFAYEGAGMAYALLDLLTLSRGRRLASLLDGPGDGYVHLVHVGAGWAQAKLRYPSWRGLHRLDPLLRWLAADGWGFFAGFFHTERTVRSRSGTRRWTAPAARIRYQGLGRSLWFVESTDAAAIADRIAGFPPEHHGSLWSGVALAAGYAGGVSDEELRLLADLGADHRWHLAQGAAFAAAARHRAGYVPEYTHRATEVLAGTTVDEAARWTAAAAAGLDQGGGAGVRRYQEWRRRIREYARDAYG
jgi:hypothetical protein